MRGFLPFPFGEHIRKSFLKSVFRGKKHFWKSFWCAVKTLPMVPKNYGQLQKNSWATGEKITGNVFQNYGQYFPKLRAMFFEAIRHTFFGVPTTFHR